MDTERKAMVADLRRYRIQDERVIEAMSKVRRGNWMAQGRLTRTAWRKAA